MTLLGAAVKDLDLGKSTLCPIHRLRFLQAEIATRVSSHASRNQNDTVRSPPGMLRTGDKHVAAYGLNITTGHYCANSA